MSIIGWIVLGLIAGIIASRIVNRAREGVIGNIALGLMGAVIGGAVVAPPGAAGGVGFNVLSMFAALVGAIVMLGAFHLVSGRGRI